MLRVPAVRVALARLRQRVANWSGQGTSILMWNVDWVAHLVITS